MKRFPYAHATHPQWRMAAALVLAQLRAQMALPENAASPALGLIYITDHYAAEAAPILEHVAAELPEVLDWVGTVGVGVAANNVEYFDEPAMVVMLCDVSPDQFRVFSGINPLAPSENPGGFRAHTALVHADGQTPDLTDLVQEMAERTTSGYLFGGLSSSRGDSVQFALSHRTPAVVGEGALGVFRGGMSGVAFGAGVGLVSRVTQGAQPVGPVHMITHSEGNLVLSLDERPALDVLLDELGISLDHPEHAMPRLRMTLVGLTAVARAGHVREIVARGQFSPDVVVRHLIGLDPVRRGVAIADRAPQGAKLAFCERHREAARADLMRVCAEIREELEPEELEVPVTTDGFLPGSNPALRRIAGAVYVSCSGRGGPHFGSPGAELQLVRHALGDVPLVGFFAGGEIAHDRIYGYTGVLTVFTTPA